ncbi:hypothetical protein BDZ85DRAFT_5271 [Elsinoe ampelina]|uniref:Uncharacterized protein n=1 Tax=Elsinoe ampelina TaxID=302913 RepID=A0A6A6GQF2_9PEZI|nr:hypothetical protein BDZ85DRAFT_5271 [Elsinoe ampelina]
MSSRSVSCYTSGQDECGIPIVDPSASRIDYSSDTICQSLGNRTRQLRRALQLLVAAQRCAPFCASSAKIKWLLVCSVQPHHTAHEALRILQADTERTMIVVDCLTAMIYKNIDNERALMRAGLQAAPRSFRSRPRILLHAYHQTSSTLFHSSLGLVSQSEITSEAMAATSSLSNTVSQARVDRPCHGDRSPASHSPWIPLHRDIREILRTVVREPPNWSNDDQPNEWRVAVISVGMMQRLDVYYGRSSKFLRPTESYSSSKWILLTVKRPASRRYQAYQWIPRQCMVTISGEDFLEVCDELGIFADDGFIQRAELLMSKLPASFPV